mmetsp:Transcript_16454/g.51058  ORF Transcript_16454/g.51058 Transcript_16454/m.51058 type:complete len:439 (-) Transcript_16454:325-1641(-)
MQRLEEISARRQKLHEELAALDAEEAEIRRKLSVAGGLNRETLELVNQSVTQQGCATAQVHLDNASEDERTRMFAAALCEITTLATQTYSALFVQKLIESLGEQCHGQLLYTLDTGNTFVEIASAQAGAHSLQRFMEILRDAPAQASFCRMIASRAVALSNHPNGCHVVLRAISHRVNVDKTELVGALVRNCVVIATNKQGCCVLQRAIEWLPDPLRDQLVDAIIAHELDLVQDAFGNYVVQHLLDRKDDKLIKRTIQPLLHNIAGLACDKFGSNVIEKCMRVAHPNIKQLLIDEITDPSVLPRLLQDSFANYVIQTAISSSSEDQFQQLHAAIRPNFASLKNSPYGVRIEAKIQRRLKDNARARQRQNKKRANQAGPGNRSPHQQHQSPSGGMGQMPPNVQVRFHDANGVGGPLPPQAHGYQMAWAPSNGDERIGVQ